MFTKLKIFGTITICLIGGMAIGCSKAKTKDMPRVNWTIYLSWK